MKKHRISIKWNSPVILIIDGVCVAAFVADTLTDGMANTIIFSTYHSSLLNPLTYTRFFTHVFGHEGLDHLLSNMVYLLLLGPMVEEKYGSEKTAVVIAVTAFATGIINYFFFPGDALCGASGVCFAFILLSSLTNFKKGEIPLTFIIVAVFFFGQQIVDSFTGPEDISYMAHIVGGITGAVFGFKVNNKGR